MPRGMIWVYTPRAQKAPEQIRKKMEKKAEELIIELKKKYIEKKHPKNWNYIADIYSKWHGHRFYLCSKYNCPGPNAISPSFENKFARIEYIGSEYKGFNNFQVFFLRHTGEWIKIACDISLDKCFKKIRGDSWFTP